MPGDRNCGAHFALGIQERFRSQARTRFSGVENGRREMSMPRKPSTVRFFAQAILLLFWSAITVWASEPKGSSSNGTNIFAPASTPAKSIADLSTFVLVITGII